MRAFFTYYVMARNTGERLRSLATTTDQGEASQMFDVWSGAQYVDEHGHRFPMWHEVRLVCSNRVLRKRTLRDWVRSDLAPTLQAVGR